MSYVARINGYRASEILFIFVRGRVNSITAVNEQYSSPVIPDIVRSEST